MALVCFYQSDCFSLRWDGAVFAEVLEYLICNVLVRGVGLHPLRGSRQVQLRNLGVCQWLQAVAYNQIMELSIRGRPVSQLLSALLIRQSLVS